MWKKCTWSYRGQKNLTTNSKRYFCTNFFVASKQKLKIKENFLLMILKTLKKSKNFELQSILVMAFEFKKIFFPESVHYFESNNNKFNP